MAQATSTKSIDVGSMFLMDLSVHESSELNCGTAKLDDSIALDIAEDSVFPSGNSQQPILDAKRPSHSNNTIHHHNHQSNENNRSYNKNQQKIMSTQSRSIGYNQAECHYRNNDENLDFSSNPLGRSAVATKGKSNKDAYDTVLKPVEVDEVQKSFRRHQQKVTSVEPQPPPEILENESPASSGSSSSSLSDDSYMIGSSGDESLNVSSYTATSVDEERGSTTTREDSGVLDIKDLDSQLNNSYDIEHEEDICQHQQTNNQEKPASTSQDAKATNLIIKSANNNVNSKQINNIDHNDKLRTKDPASRTRKPTNATSENINNHIHHNHHHNQYYQLRNSQSKCSVSASLPIEVPVRQMKKSLNKSKLMNNNKDTKCNNKRMPAYKSNAMNAAIDDFEDFLEQEYNDNHHNHYPIDEFDEDHVRAGENPMKLFQSIQALARSLHEDTELFGSLPPKRLLESPIRSLALT